MRTLFSAVVIARSVALGPSSAGSLPSGDLGPDACKMGVVGRCSLRSRQMADGG